MRVGNSALKRLFCRHVFEVCGEGYSGCQNGAGRWLYSFHLNLECRKCGKTATCPSEIEEVLPRIIRRHREDEQLSDSILRGYASIVEEKGRRRM